MDSRLRTSGMTERGQQSFLFFLAIGRGKYHSWRDEKATPPSGIDLRITRALAEVSKHIRTQLPLIHEKWLVSTFRITSIGADSPVQSSNCPTA